MMGKTYRRTKTKNKKAPDKDGNNDFWLRHDITPIRRGMNQSFREEEKEYFRLTCDTKFNQKPKSRGRTQ